MFQGVFFSILLSFGPAIFYVWLIYWLDRYEPEPLPLVYSVFVWGAIVAAGGAFVINGLANEIFQMMFSTSQQAIFAQTTIIAPIVEEALKIIALLIVFIFRTDEFDSIIDGVVYAGVVAIGFAATENVFYLFQGGYVSSGWQGLFLNFFFRVILGAWNHMLYTSIFGIGLAIARLNNNNAVRIFIPLLGGLLAVGVHSIHNTLHYTAQTYSNLFLVIAVDWLAWVGLALIIFIALRQERLWVFREMQSEVARGTISRAQYIQLISPRQNWVDYYRSIFNKDGVEGGTISRISTELAYKKHQMKLIGTNKGNLPSAINEYRSKLKKALSESGNSY